LASALSAKSTVGSSSAKPGQTRNTTPHLPDPGSRPMDTPQFVDGCPAPSS
jgi:hypothetical protein